MRYATYIYREREHYSVYCVERAVYHDIYMHTVCTCKRSPAHHSRHTVQSQPLQPSATWSHLIDTPPCKMPPVYYTTDLTGRGVAYREITEKKATDAVEHSGESNLAAFVRAVQTHTHTHTHTPVRYIIHTPCVPYMEVCANQVRVP